MRKRRRLKHKLLLFILVDLFIILLCCLFIILFPNKVEKPKPIQNDNKPKEQSISMLMVGDALLHTPLFTEAKIDDNHYDFNSIFDRVKSLFSGYDLLFYNQESIIGGKSLGLHGYPLFNAPEEFGDIMVDMGFNMVSLANNHALDKGETGLTNSMNYWRNKNVMTAGTYLSESDRIKDNIKVKNGISYALLSYTKGVNGLTVPAGKDYLVNIYNPDKVKADIERIRDKVDVLIVSMHWGVEYSNTPNDEQVEIANYLSSLGVDIIIGHHPHVIEPITYVNGTLVFYSLGNFISGQVGVDKLTGMIGTLKITKTTTNDKVNITYSDVNANLIYTYYKDFKNFKIIPFSEINSNYLSNYDIIYNKYNNIITSLDKSITVTKLNSN